MKGRRVDSSSGPRRILITGYSGFVGSYLVLECRRYYPDAEIYGLCQPTDEQHPHPHDEPTLSQSVVRLEADITHSEQVHMAVAAARPTLVFHLAGQASVSTSWADPVATLSVNAVGAVHLLEALRAEQMAPRVVLVGSGEQYGLVQPEENPIRETCPFRPANPYAVSKAAQDLYGLQYFVAYRMPILRVRPFNHFGPRQATTFVVASFARQIALIEAAQAEPVLSVGNLRARRDFLPVQDVVRAYIAVAERGQPGEAYNVGSGNARSVGDILDMLVSCAKVPIRVREDPARLRPVDVPLLVADTTKLRTHTGWQPSVDVEWALRETLDFWREKIAET